MRRMKNEARLKKISLNSYVESLIEKDLENREQDFSAFSRLGGTEVLSERTLALTKYHINLTREQISEDPRLEYLLSK